MIIKSMGRKGGGSIQALSEYITREDAVLKKDDAPYIIRHNVFGTMPQILKQFVDVENRRIHRRADNNQVLHTVLSFAPEDRVHLNPEKLERIARQYIEKLNPNVLAISAIHMGNDADNPHIHILISGATITGEAMRISKDDFAQLKENMEQWQEMEFPELTASHVEHNQNKAESDPPKPGSEKEQIQNLVSASFGLAQSQTEFIELLKEDGLEVYERGGKLAGVTGERNFRFATLGFDLEELDEREARVEELNNVELPEETERESQEPNNEEELTEQEIERLKELDDLNL